LTLSAKNLSPFAHFLVMGAKLPPHIPAHPQEKDATREHEARELQELGGDAGEQHEQSVIGNPLCT
jgi:hypothetical protein